MAKLFIKTNFQHNGKVYRTNEEGDVVLTILNKELENELALGKHPDTDKYMSGVLNHCSPADADAKRIVNGETVPDQLTDEELQEQKKEAEEQTKKEKLYIEFDKIGKSYDKRWGLSTLRMQLGKARKEAGE